MPLKKFSDYRRAFWMAVILHVVVLGLLLMQLPATSVRMPGPTAKQQVISAMAVDAQQVAAQVRKIQSAQKHQRAVAHARARRLAQKEAALKASARRAERALAELKRAKSLAQKKLAHEQALARKAHATRLAAQAAAKRRAQLLSERKKLQQKLMRQQLAQESTQIAQAQKAAQTQGIIDRYAAQIKQAVEANLIKPSNYQSGQSCVYQVELAQSGTVLRLRLIRASGNAAFDQAARVAILRTAPLPVPKDPALFARFQTLRLTLNPYQDM